MSIGPQPYASDAQVTSASQRKRGTVFVVDPEDFASKTGASTEEKEKAGAAVAQLVDRFDLAGKTIMAIGPGTATEEVAMLRRGAKQLLLFDIDEHGSLRPILELCKPASETSPHIVYVLGDFRDTINLERPLPPVDVLYMSGFTLDEKYRGDHSARATQRTLERWARGETVEDPNWPENTPTLHDIVRSALDLYLRDGGILIIQSYSHGVDVVSNKNYIADWQRTLASHDMYLIEGYHHTASTAVTLWVAMKGEAASRRFRAHLEGRSQLSTFHFRSALPDHSIMRFF